MKGVSDGIDRLIFRWPERGASFVLPTFFLLALVLHASAFFLFEIIYPPVGTIAPPPAQIVLIAPTTPENQAFLQSLETENPAIVARMAEITPTGLGEIRYHPSYKTPSTLPKTADHRRAPIPLPPAFDPLALLTPPRLAAPPAHRTLHTTLSFSEALRPRDAATDTPLQLAVKVEGAHQPSVFLIGIDDRGELRYTFLQSSSGHRQLDQEAEKQLHDHPFHHDESAQAPAITWGFVTFTWGADVVSVTSPPDESDSRASSPQKTPR